MKRIYLDNNATTPVAPEVVEAMLPFLRDAYGNASSLHAFGQEARAAVDAARTDVAALLNADPEEIIFTSGGTESDNLAVKGTAMLPRNAGGHVVTTAVEHHAVLNSCLALEERGYAVTYVPVDRYGTAAVSDVAAALRDDTVLVSVMTANNEVGTLQPVAEIGALARERGIPFHTDAVQAAGKVPLDVKALNVDLLALSGHKINGPKGVGALYVRRGTRLHKLAHGGHHEFNRRAGTENVPGIAGMGAAARAARAGLDGERVRLTALRDRLWRGLSERLDEVRLNGHPEHRLATTLNVSFGYVEGEALLLNFDLAGIAVSSGSACTSGSPEPSHVLTAMGIDPIFAQGAIRFSLGRDTTESDIDYVIERACAITDRLRAMSPLYSRR